MIAGLGDLINGRGLGDDTDEYSLDESTYSSTPTDLSNILAGGNDVSSTYGLSNSNATFSVGLPTTGSYAFSTSVTPVAASSSSSVNWGNVEASAITSAINTTSKAILQNSIPAGQLQETLANGQTITYQQPTGANNLAIPGLTSSLGSYLPILLLLGGGFLLISALGKGKA